MRGLVALIAVLLTSACVLRSEERMRHAEVDREHEESARSLRTVAISNMVAPDCKDSTYRGPSKITTRETGEPVQQDCGLVTVEISAERFMSKFVEKVCAGIDGPDCGRLYYEMFIARLRERYPMAEWEGPLNRCKAYPFDCTFETLELWVLESHNASVTRWAEAAYANLEAQGTAPCIALRAGDRAAAGPG